MKRVTMRGWVLRCGALAAASVSLTMLPVGGMAYAQTTLDPLLEEHLGSAAQFYAAESGAADVACDVGCQALKNDLRRAPTAPRDRVVPRLFKALVDKGRSVIRPPWRLPPGSIFLARATLIGANVYVWKVHVFGAHPKDYFIKVPVEAFTLAKVTKWVTSDGLDTSWFLTYFALPNPIPVGLIAATDDRAAVLWQTSTYPGSRCSEPGAAEVPPYVEEYLWHWNRCFEGYVDGVETYSDLTAHGWKMSIDTSFDGALDTGSLPDLAATYSVNGELLTFEQILARLKDLLTSGDPDYDVLKAWFDSVFGGESPNPKDVYHTTPSCVGVTAAACTTLLRNAGFTGTITTSTLTSTEAVMEQAAGRVTDTSPSSDLQIAEPRSFVIYVNPATMPKMTATETKIADKLATNNPDTVNATNKKTLARTCVRFAKAASRATGDCTALPILVHGKDMAEPARNAIAGLERNPAWFALNRRVRPTPTQWYKDRADPAPGCVVALRSLEYNQCDEYPFWSTLQAYGGSLNTAVPSIRWVPQAQNGRQGRVLDQFYGTNGPGSVLAFKGCNITAQPATAVAPTADSTFLNVPLAPGTPILSTGICNKP